MHPAFSVIFLTTLIGAGQGLFVALFAVQLAQRHGIIAAVDHQWFVIGTLMVLVLMCLGLLASFFHLGRPERCLRTVVKWRTSWLSREVIVLPAFTATVALWGLLHYFGYGSAGFEWQGYHWVASIWLGFLALVLALLLFYCTGMIYASVRFIQEWATPLTVLNFSLIGLASGFTLASAFSGWLALPITTALSVLALALLLAALLGRVCALKRNKGLKPVSSVQTAIGIKHPRIVQTSQGAMGGSFNTREFFHHKSDGFLGAVKRLFFAAAFIIPALLLLLGMVFGSQLLLFAVAVQAMGLLAERWYFFAQANHPQNVYYQAT